MSGEWSRERAKAGDPPNTPAVVERGPAPRVEHAEPLAAGAEDEDPTHPSLERHAVVRDSGGIRRPEAAGG